MNEHDFKLIGFDVPMGEPHGFINPIFKKDEEYWIQDIDESGNIINFIEDEELEPSPLMEKHLPSSLFYKVGSPALYVFAFDKNNVVIGNKKDVADQLKAKFKELDKYPFIKREVLQFIGIEESQEYLKAIDAAAEVLALSNPKVAENWKKREYKRVTSNIFIGRKDEKEIFENFIKSSSENYILNIHTNGDGGIGKTQLLLQFQIICQKRSDQVLYNKRLIDFYHTETRTKIDLMRLIVEALTEKQEEEKYFLDFNKKSEKYQTRDEELPENFTSELERIFYSEYEELVDNINKTIVLFFDTYESIQGHDFAKWIEREFFPKLFDLNNNTRIVVAGRKPLKRVLSKEIELGAFTIRDTYEFWKKCFKLPSDEALEKRIGNKEIIEKVHILAKGRPILLALFADWCNYEHNRLIPEKTILSIEKEIQEKGEESKESIFEEILVNRIRSLKKPEDLAVIYMAFAYRRMTPDMLSFIANIPLWESRNILLKDLRPLSFIKYKEDQQSVLLHDEMRNLINLHYWDKIDPNGTERKQIANKLVEYYDKLLADPAISSTQEAILYSERLFYQLYANINLGFNDFTKKFDHYLNKHQIYFSDLVGSELLTEQYYPELYYEHKLEFIIRRIRWRNAQYRCKEALFFFEDVEDMFPDDKDILYVDDDKQILEKFFASEKSDKEILFYAYFKHERGEANLWLGRFDQAINYFSSSEKSFRQYKHIYRVAWELNWYGYACYRSGDFDKAEKAFKNSNREFVNHLKKEKKRHPEFNKRILNVYSNLNALFRHKGRFFEAILNGEIAVSIARKKEYHHILSRFLNALGETYKNVYRYFHSTRAYNEALGCLEKSPDPLLNARILIGKALIAYRQPEYIYILEFYKKDNRKEAISKFREMYPAVTNQLIEKNENTKTKTALEMLSDAQFILEQDIKDETTELADLHFYLAEAATIDDEWEQAIGLFKQSEKVARNVNNEYREIDAIVYQIISYYYFRKNQNEFENEIKDCEKKVRESKNNYHNLLGKMEIILSNILYEHFLETKDIENLKQAIMKCVIACEHMYKFSKISLNRFYACFQILTQRLADIDKEKLPLEEDIENLRYIWIYDENDLNVCQDYADKFNEIIDFLIQRTKLRKNSGDWESYIKFYKEKIVKCIEHGGEELRFAPVYALMSLSLHADKYGKKKPNIAEAYIDLAHAFAVTDNIFESQKNNHIALELIKNNDNDLLRARIFIRLGTILYRRGEYARLTEGATSDNIEDIKKKFLAHNKNEVQNALNYFKDAEKILKQLNNQYPENKMVLNKIAHLFFRKAECLFLTGHNSSEIEELFNLSIDNAKKGEDLWRQMAAIEGLIRYYYLSGQWEKKLSKIKTLRDKFYNLSRKRYAPVLMGRMSVTLGDANYYKIKSNSTDVSLIKKIFSNYTIATRIKLEYSEKHFYETISTYLDRISRLPKESLKILHQDIFPELKQKGPRGEVAEDAYKLLEQCIYLHSEVL